ncbi:S-adenosyl-L-methionine-dependent methyltransferase, partial [Rhodotorula sp. JG-1b]
GNYIGYYRRRREVQHGELDDRLELVPREWIRGKRVLDVGANAGEVSIELAQRFRAAEVVGVDIDPELTQQARRNDLTVEDSAYFPTSLARMFGFLPHPRGLVRSYTESNAVSPRRNRRDANYVEHLFFPENIVFETADWVNTPLQADRDGYDVIFALSVTKWIHLQGLNPGLLAFFRRCFDCLRPGGRLILEPQPFSTYAKNVKTMPELQERYDKL